MRALRVYKYMIIQAICLGGGVLAKALQFDQETPDSTTLPLIHGSARVNWGLLVAQPSFSIKLSNPFIWAFKRGQQHTLIGVHPTIAKSGVLSSWDILYSPSWLYKCLGTYSYEITRRARLNLSSKEAARGSCKAAFHVPRTKARPAWTVVPSVSTNIIRWVQLLVLSPHGSPRTG